MKKLLHIAMLVSIVLLAGCIKENYDDCERCKLTFSYTGDVNYDIFQQKISCVSLYVFDDKNSLVQTKRIEQSDLKAYQGTKLNLSPGSYRIVGVGNDMDLTEIESAQNHDQAIFLNPDTKSTNRVVGNDSLYLGTKMITIPEDYWYEDDVPFRSSHLKVSYTVIGYVDAAEENVKSSNSILELKVKNLLPQTDFTNKAHGNKTTYNPVLEVEKNTGNHIGRFNIMRHAKDSDVVFELADKKTGEVVHTLALADFLNKYPQIDVSKQEVLIPIVVEFKNIGVTVTIPDWMVNDVTPDYGNKSINE
ncbi:MAG: hypothetical protein E7121_01840 [Bacteroidales bacterium]|nr:hypothetical protein [Bacteroidales bacterium]MBQ8034576.1 FimB/Mfa2 family fimbrial subunit [Bacteroidales bacterium]MBR4094525.1 FimB/Mfa2 family fimbrial subunit [Bacteroidales bacterium]